MSKIRVGGVWKNFTRKIRVGGVWKLACLKYRIGGVWKSDSCGVELFLPNPLGVSTTINLATFIAGENIGTSTKVTVINNFTQPKVISGTISGIDVTFVNNGEIQGNVAGGNAFQATSALVLDNSGGVIRGAGGNGGKGGNGTGLSRTVMIWSGWRKRGTPGAFNARLSNTNPWYWSFAASTPTVQIGSDPQTRAAGGITWGNQAGVWLGASSSPLQASGGGFNLAENSSNSLSATSGGSGGAGQKFGTTATNGAYGTNGTVSGSAGFNSSNGINNTQYSTTQNKGGRGGKGGAWGTSGNTGSNSADGNGGSAGTSAGKSITGSAYLSGSNFGTPGVNTIGSIS